VVGDPSTTSLPVFAACPKLVPEMGPHSLCDVVLLSVNLEFAGQSKSLCIWTGWVEALQSVWYIRSRRMWYIVRYWIHVSHYERVSHMGGARDSAVV
jgi:hypothetical protein